MDQEPTLQVGGTTTPEDAAAPIRRPASGAAREGFSRRRLLRLGLGGMACAACGGGLAYYVSRRIESVAAAEIFPGDAPKGRIWDDWKRRGWAHEARHWVSLGGSIQCGLCPNQCILEPEDRGRCRNRVFKEGKLWTLAYANPCAMHIDPIEKKPLFHFMPGTGTFSLAASGCGFRCLNCQNWDISQRKPEETKDPRGDGPRFDPRLFSRLSSDELSRGTMLPEDAVALSQFYDCPSLSYTYSEPTVWFEYMIDMSRAARAASLKNVWVTCGYIQAEPLDELCEVLDAANVDLKSFDDGIYRQLNSGKLGPILDTLRTLKRRGVWFEVTNLIVPQYTDRPEMIRRMCGWLVEHLGPDYPLHFSRFHPQHKLTHLPPTPVEVLAEARDIARSAGLHYVYVGNCREVDDAETTYCPGCRRAVVERNVYRVAAVRLDGGKCDSCGTPIAGVWSS
jgi:pyruvate formate lyase activating enzyme